MKKPNASDIIKTFVAGVTLLYQLMHMNGNTKSSPSTVGVRVRSIRVEQNRKEWEKRVVYSLLY